MISVSAVCKLIFCLLGEEVLWVVVFFLLIEMEMKSYSHALRGRRGVILLAH